MVLFLPVNKLAHLVKLEWSMWENEDHILCTGKTTKVIIDHRTDIHSRKSIDRKYNFHANFEHTYKKISIFSVIVHQTLFTLLNLLLYLYIFTLFLPLLLHLSVSSSCLGLMQVLCIDQNVRAQGCFTLLFFSLYLFMWHRVLLPHPAQCFAGIQML